MCSHIDASPLWGPQDVRGYVAISTVTFMLYMQGTEEMTLVNLALEPLDLMTEWGLSQVMIISFEQDPARAYLDPWCAGMQKKQTIAITIHPHLGPQYGKGFPATLKALQRFSRAPYGKGCVILLIPLRFGQCYLSLPWCSPLVSIWPSPLQGVTILAGVSV